MALLGLEEDATVQLDLFEAALRVGKMRRLYESVDEVRRKYGKHTLYRSSSFLANQFGQHLGERGDIPKRKETLHKEETARKRLGIPIEWKKEPAGKVPFTEITALYGDVWFEKPSFTRSNS